MGSSYFDDKTSNYSMVDPTEIFGPQRDPLYIVIPITILYILIFITGLIGNVFTCLVIVRNKNMHTATNYYLFSLAISDLLLLLFGMPLEIYSIWSKWPYVFGSSCCLLRGLASETSTNASVLTITLFTTERYLAICHPFLSHKMSKLSRAIRHVAMLWLAAFVFALPQALELGVKDHQGVALCIPIRVIIEHSFELSTFLFFFAPMILITVLYSFIGLRLKQSNADKENQDRKLFESQRMTDRIRRKPSKSTRRVVKMLVAVVVAFFICWAPFHAQRLVAIYGTTADHQAKSPILHKVYLFLTYISGVFYYVSTCINPIFYHIMSNKFRDAFKVTVAQMCCKKVILPNNKKYSYSAVAAERNASSTGPNNGSIMKSNSSKPSRGTEKTDNNQYFLIIEAKQTCDSYRDIENTNGNHGNTLNCSMIKTSDNQSPDEDNNIKHDSQINLGGVHFINEFNNVASLHQKPVISNKQAVADKTITNDQKTK